MSTERLTSVPDAIIAGDTVLMTLSFSDYLAPTWDLSLSLAGPDTLTVASVDNSTGHDLSVTALQSAALGAGLYQWRVRATDGTEVRTIETGVLTVTADLAALAPGDATPIEVRHLALVELAIQGTLEGQARMTMINNRQLQTFGLDELYKLRSQLLRAIARLENGGQLPPVMVGRWRTSHDDAWQ